MYLSQRYCQIIAELKRQGVSVGAIRVTKQATRDLSLDIPDGTDAEGLAWKQIFASVGAGEDVDVSIGYLSSRAIDRYLIFLTTIKAVGEAAEWGLDRHVQSIETQGIRQVFWKLVGGTLAFTGVLKPGHSRIAIVKTLGTMIEDRKSQSVIV
ncbi:MAG: hypothetical protein Q9196_000490 [Gyalolechia fulgens]